MQANFTVLVAAIAAVLVAGLWIVASGHRREGRLERLRAQRGADEAEARCLAAFPQFDAVNVRAAYRWVQALVALEGMPLLPQDDLRRTLCVDPGDIDDKFDAAREYCGPGRDDAAARRPLDTVQALMAAVLAAGYEFFPPPDPSLPPER